MTIAVERWQFTVADYHRMQEVGIVPNDARVELIDGEIRTMSPIGPNHAAIVKRLTNLLAHLLFGKYIIGAQDPIELNDYSEPQPDTTILSFRDDYYANGHPRPEDVLVVVEISDTSLDYDRTVKLLRYAEAHIPEAWIIDLAAQTVEQYTQPANGRYTRIHILQHGDTLSAQTLALEIDIDTLFGL